MEVPGEALLHLVKRVHRDSELFDPIWMARLITGPFPTMQASSLHQPSDSIPGSTGRRPSGNRSAFFKLHLPSFSLKVTLVLMVATSSERNKWEMLPSEAKEWKHQWVMESCPLLEVHPEPPLLCWGQESLGLGSAHSLGLGAPGAS